MKPLLEVAGRNFSLHPRGVWGWHRDMLINTHTPTRAITHFTVSSKPASQPSALSAAAAVSHSIHSKRRAFVNFLLIVARIRCVRISIRSMRRMCHVCICICAYRWRAAAHEWREKRAAQLSADLWAECWVALVVVGALLVFRVTRSIVVKPDRPIYTIHERTFCSTDM